MISTMKFKRISCKGCQVFPITMREIEEEDPAGKTLDHPILQEYVDVFPSEIIGMPLKRDIDFDIDLIPGVEPISSARYQMTNQDLSDLHLHLEHLLAKGCI